MKSELEKRHERDESLHGFLKNAINGIGDQLSGQERLDFLESIEAQEEQWGGPHH